MVIRKVKLQTINKQQQKTAGSQRGDFKRLRIQDSLLGEMTRELVFVVRWSYLDRWEMGMNNRFSMMSREEGRREGERARNQMLRWEI